jgi:histidinol dehydrogenase
VFVGRYSAVACGDYASGTNHILPTAGYPSIKSGLDVNHFLRRTSVQMISKDGLDHIGDMVITLAKAEGLHEHARSVEIRRKR